MEVITMITQWSKQTLVLILLILSPSLCLALLITVEPDDYAPGTDLSNISSYVTIRSNYFGEINPIKAEVPSSFPAPTGNLTFSGLHGYFSEDKSYGFELIFHQAVSAVQLLAQSVTDYGVEWAVFDNNDNLLKFDSAGPQANDPLGTPYLVDMQLDNIWSIVIGGSDGIVDTRFDHLIFETVDVDEPSMPWLLCLVLTGLFGLQRKKLSSV
jgi:hypothetical protein